MKLTKEKAAFFKTMLIEKTAAVLVVAEEIETDTVYGHQVLRYPQLSRGQESVQFIIRADDEGQLYLDYYYITDDSKSHFRIDHTGAFIRLENFEGQWGWPEYEDEEQTKREHDRIRENNATVTAILEAKGFAVYELKK